MTTTTMMTTIKKHFYTLLLVLAAVLAPARLYANNNAEGWCEKGNEPVGTANLTSTTKVQRSYPSCLVTVYLHGVAPPTYATLYSDNAISPTALANPFTASSTGFWQFYAADNRYDIVLSGGGLAVPYTISNVIVYDPFRTCVDFPGNDMSLKLANCIVALPSTGGIADATQFVGNQPWSTCPFTGVTKPVTVQFGSSTSALGVSCTVPLNVTLVMYQGMQLAPNSGSDLYIAGICDCDRSTHFGGTGSNVHFLPGGTPEIPVEWFGAKADNTTDSWFGIQSAANSITQGMSGSLPVSGGKITFSVGVYKTSQTVFYKGITTFEGASFGGIVSSDQHPTSIIQGTFNGALFSPAEDPSWYGTFRYLALYGTVNSGSRGIYGAGKCTPGLVLESDFFNQFGDEAVKTSCGAGGTLTNLFSQNTLIIRTGRSDYIGGIDIGMSDAVWNEVVSTASVSQATGQIGDGFIAGIVVRGAANFLTNCVGHLSQVGIVIYADIGIFTGDRADLNQGAGFVVLGGGNSFTNNLSLRNSQDGVGLYPGFYINQPNNIFSNNQVRSIDADAPIEMSYGFQDVTNASTDPTFGNQYSDTNRAFLVTGGLYNFTGQTPKGCMQWNGIYLQLCKGFTTPRLGTYGVLPTVVPGNAGGAGATAVLSSDSNDVSGCVTLTTATDGSRPTANGLFFMVTYNVPYPVLPHVRLAPINYEANALVPGAFARESPHSTINFFVVTGDPTYHLANTTDYKWCYLVDVNIPSIP